MILLLLSRYVYKGWKCYFHSSRTKPRGHRDYFWRSSNSGGSFIKWNTCSCVIMMNSSSLLCLYLPALPLPPPPPPPLVPPLSRFSDRSCLVIPDLGCDSCGPCPSEWLFLLTPKHCGLCYHTMFSHEIYAFELHEISNECACFSCVVGGRHPNCVWASLWTTVSDQAWTLLLLLLHSMWTLPMSPLWATNKGS